MSYKKTSIGRTSVGSSIEQQKQLLQPKKEWVDAATIISECLFDDMVCPNYDFGMCFLVQATEVQLNSVQSRHKSFMPALATVLEVVNVNSVSLPLLKLFAPFIENYEL